MAEECRHPHDVDPAADLMREQVPSEWALIDYEAARPMFLATAPHDDKPGWRIISPTATVDQVPDGGTELTPLAESLVRPLDADQVALLVELLLAARERAAAPQHQP